ncbi:MAG: hypothetical protein R6U95_03625 [Bacteroidales bacterium]
MPFIRFNFIYIIACVLCVSYTTTAQESLMIYGQVDVVDDSMDGAWLKVLDAETYDIVYHNPIDDDGTYRIDLPYGENYTISFTKPGYTTIEFFAKLKLPKDARQCCYRPMKISFHFFKPDSMYAHLFEGTFHTITYKPSLKGFNYDIDVDYMVQQRIVNYEIFEQKKKMAKEGKAMRNEDLLTEKKYVALINQANKMYESEHFYAARKLFVEASELRPNRNYPKYKIQDIKTELVRFENKADLLGVDVDSIIQQEYKALQPQEEEEIYPAYEPLSDEQIDSIFREEVERQIQIMAETPEEKQELESAMNDFFNETYTEDIDEEIDEGIEEEIVAEDQEESVEDVLDEDVVDERMVDFTQPDVVEEDEKDIVSLNDTVEEDVSETIVDTVDSAPVVNNAQDYPKNMTYRSYQDSLQREYPAKRSIEYPKTPEKRITRVFLNNGNVVEVYTRVEHMWGATFYFIEEFPSGYQSIGYSAFMNKTHLYEIEGEDK